MTRQQIIDLIFASIDEYNAQASPGKELKKSEDTVIFGGESSLDSLGLVNFIVTLEQEINDTFNLDITLADERAMSQQDSPFKTASTLADYILSITA